MKSHQYLLLAAPDSLAQSVLPFVLANDERLSVTSDPFDALARLGTMHYDAVLVALDENDEDAAVVCRMLRRHSDAPIVMIVSSRARAHVVRGYRLGAHAHIQIPCDPREFRARVAAVVRRHPSPAV